MRRSPETLAALRDALAGWYHARRRHLPWREDPTPYRVWVSEIMLQQTQVATVLPYFDRFVTAFPDVASLAAADEQDVLAMWSGLGYYRRARHLHEAARQVVAEHGGAVPSDPATLLGLKGVGRYTAAAIASIAFGVPAAVLDGNVSRVLARLVAEDRPVDAPAVQRDQWELAEALLDPTAPSAHNQAMMELGALVCAPKAPDCAGCPVAAWCAAGAAGNATDYPRKAGRTKVKPVHAVCGLVERDDGALLVARRPDDVLLGGLWELPGAELAHARAKRREAVAAAFGARLDLAVEVGGHLGTVEHVFTHRKLTLDVYRVRGPLSEAPRPRWYTDVAWLDPAEPDAVPLSKLTRKVLAVAARTRAGGEA
ncbi:MAG: A/G-specific adenine glycosylase [Deltaproteobacteria bacterium]|nr:MAG: A/G-specific adenine glycosylase [Deltaproteobacteria bacterium]